jgi:hypothetical protein
VRRPGRGGQGGHRQREPGAAGATTGFLRSCSDAGAGPAAYRDRRTFLSQGEDMPGSVPNRYVVRVVPPVWGPAEVAVLDAALAAASRRLSDAGVAVRFLQTIPGDDRPGAVCIFEAESPAAVLRVLRTAQVPVSRIDAAPDPSGATPARPQRLPRQAPSRVIGSARHGANGGRAPTPQPAHRADQLCGPPAGTGGGQAPAQRHAAVDADRVGRRG